LSASCRRSRRSSRRRRLAPRPTAAPAPTPAVTPANVLASIPAGLRDPLLAELNGIATTYRLRKWEPSELKVGKLCEIVYTILAGMVAPPFAAKPTKPKSMEKACQDLANAPMTFPRTLRLTMPRVIVGLYEIRNDRGVGHAGGDVDPNHMDATMVLAGAKWLVAELIRIHHNVETATATQVVDALVERTVPGIWTNGVVRRVLPRGLTRKQETLLLIYGATGPARVAELVGSIEAPSVNDYRKDVLTPMHADRLIEFDRTAQTVVILPPGEAQVESELAEHL
jgi:hypothetical protein